MVFTPSGRSGGVEVVAHAAGSPGKGRKRRAAPRGAEAVVTDSEGTGPALEAPSQDTLLPAGGTLDIDPGSDSSEDERPARNTVGAVPLEWYKGEEHIGYDRAGAAIARRGPGVDALDRVLARNDAPGLALRTLYDPYNDETLTLSRRELRALLNIRAGKLPDVVVDAHEDLVDWYSNEVERMPASGAPEPKRRFMPSKWEEKKVVKLVRAIRRGWIKIRDAEGESGDDGSMGATRADEPLYMMWGDDGLAGAGRTAAGLTYVAPPKPDLPGPDESYNPPEEYLPSAEERAAWHARDDGEEQASALPTAYGSLRAVPQYPRAVHERFERCLDLYLCPRARRRRPDVATADALLPRSLPKPTELRPFPNRLCLEFRGHAGKVWSISVDAGGQWLLSAGEDGTLRVWDVLTGRCHQSWSMGARVRSAGWCPDPALRIASCVVGSRAVLLPVAVGAAPIREASAAALRLAGAGPGAGGEEQDAAARAAARWEAREDGGIEVVHGHELRSIAWHDRGDYFACVAPAGAKQSVAVHKLSTKTSQAPFRKVRGRVVTVAFHPTKPFFFLATETGVRVYNLAKQALAKRLLAGGGAIAAISVHPGGDHLLVGTHTSRVLWFDLDLGAEPHKVMKHHTAAVRGVAYHQRYPLFASAGDDGCVHVFHGMVYSDLLTDPVIVPVKLLKGHAVKEHAGVLDVCFHPTQPWLLTAGADGKVCLFVDV